MNKNEKRDYVLYRLESAHKTLEAALLLADNGLWNSAINRLYYALFYAVSALLLAYEIQAKTHSATITQFSQHFVKTGLYEKKYGTLLTRLFDNRLKGDYGDIFDFDEETVRSLFNPVQEMIERIEQEIKVGNL